MKWANVNGQYKPKSNAEKKFFADMTTKTTKKILTTEQKQRKALVGNGFQLWVKHPEKGKPKFKITNPRIRRKYEIFCGGFLYFYDNELGNYASDEKLGKYDKKSADALGSFFKSKGFELDASGKRLVMDHEIGFVWNEKGTKIEIYLKPGPSANPDPPSTPQPPPPEDSFA